MGVNIMKLYVNNIYNACHGSWPHHLGRGGPRIQHLREGGSIFENGLKKETITSES